MFKHILIPTDGSEISKRAVRQGVELAQSVNARVTLLTVSPPMHALALESSLVPSLRKEYDVAATRAARKRLDEAEALAASRKVRVASEHVFSDSPSEAIIDTARKGRCDLVFMASHGRRGLDALLLGSETQKVLTHCKIPVLVCR